MKIINIIMLFILLLASSAVAWDESSPVEIKRDPFDHPALVKQMEQKKKPVIEETVNLKLKATLVAKQDSMANVNGVLLNLGESIEGYRLLRVNEGEAVLEKNGKIVVVGTTDGRLVALDAANGMHVTSVQVGQEQLGALTFSPGAA